MLEARLKRAETTLGLRPGAERPWPRELFLHWNEVSGALVDALNAGEITEEEYERRRAVGFADYLDALVSYYGNTITDAERDRLRAMEAEGKERLKEYGFA